MQKNRLFKYTALLISGLLILSCSQYNKILKGSNYELKFRKAVECFNKKDYERASTLFEQVVNVFRGSSKGDSLYYFYAYCNYYTSDYLMASHLFQELTDNYPLSVFAEESDYMIGYCFYKESPKPSLDQEYTIKGIQAFQMFTYKNAKSKYVPECQRLISELNEKLVEKSYLNARLYYRLDQYKSAIIALRNSLAKYPETKYREELMFMILESNYLLASKSVPEKQKERYQSTLDEYYSFVSEYPNSKYNSDVKKIFDKTKDFLGI
jgi:outer membrane protein assembly factor BamD